MSIVDSIIERAKPILFNTEMVRAILFGNKTQTRRIKTGKKTRWKKGDILYVRETWCFLPCITCGYESAGICAVKPKLHEDPDGISSGCYLYRANNLERLRWRPSIHMPKRAARIFLEVEEVRSERLQDISPEDCVAEGADADALALIDGEFVRGMFSSIWDSTLTKEQQEWYSWEANPEVDVYTFRMILSDG